MLGIQRCPCGSGLGYDGCCGPLHRGEREAATAEELMRSRYAAYALDEYDYLFRTWHPRTRPDRLGPTTGLTWIGLEIVATERGRPDDDHGRVEFVASYRLDDDPGTLHENSLFERRGGRWVYVAPQE